MYGDEGLRRTRGRASLRAGSRALSEGGRGAPALPDALRPLGISPDPRRVPHRAAARRPDGAFGPAWAGHRHAAPGPSGGGTYLLFPGGVLGGPRPPAAGDEPV